MQTQSLRVGLTGNIGSGKSTVARLFERLGVPVYYADRRAKSLMVSDPDLRQSITDLFGPDAYVDYRSSNPTVTGATDSPTLNRAWIAERIFADDSLLTSLNGIVHPAVAADALRWHRSHPEQAYTLHEAAITYETGGDRALDYVIVVTAPEEIRLARVRQRDGTTPEQIRARMAKQWPEAEKIARADHRIINDGHHLLLPQVLRLHRLLTTAAADGAENQY